MADPQRFVVEVTSVRSVVRARLAGELDAAALPVLLDELQPLAEVARSVVLDCSDLVFCDSSGLRGLVVLRNSLGSGGGLVLEGASDALRDVLDLTGLSSLIDDAAEPA